MIDEDDFLLRYIQITSADAIRVQKEEELESITKKIEETGEEISNLVFDCEQQFNADLSEQIQQKILINEHQLMTKNKLEEDLQDINTEIERLTLIEFNNGKQPEAVSIYTPGFKISDFEDLKEIGYGGEGTVYKGFLRDKGQFFAIKTIERNIRTQTNSSSGIKLKEAELLIQNSENDHIVRVFGLLIEEVPSKKEIGYVMEFMENGCLYRIIHNLEIKYDLRQIYSWIRQASDGLMYLHKRKIIHRDVKPANMLLGNSINHLKISDFGLAKSLANCLSSITKGVGTLAYMSPEVIKDQKYSFPADVYALTISIWEMFHREMPFSKYADESQYTIGNLIINENKRPKLMTSDSLFLPKILHRLKGNKSIDKKTSSLYNLLKRGWDVNPKERPKLYQFFSFACRFTEEDSSEENTPQPTQSVMLLGGYCNDITDAICIYNSKEEVWHNCPLKLPCKLTDHGSVILKDEIYIFGGWNGDECCKFTYKLGENGKWIKLADMNENRSNIGSSSVVFENEIWVFGGMDGTNIFKTVEKYNPKINSWTQMTQMNQARNPPAVSIINGKFYVSGGFDGRNYLNTIEVYDPENEKWEIFINMPFALCRHASIVDGTNLIIIGGRKSDEKPSDEVWKINVMDPKKEWKKMPNLQQPRCYHGAVKLEDGLMAIGGCIDNKTRIDSVEIFNGHEWIEAAKLPEIRGAFSLIPLTS